MSFIKIENLVHKFYEKDNDGKIINEKNALDGIDIEVSRGQFIAILGRNGSGKSTLARHLNCLLYPDEGAIWINGNVVDEENEEEMWKNRKTIGMVFQNPDNQIIGMTVEEDAAFGPENLMIPPDEIRKRVDSSLYMTQMDKKKHLSPNSLSGGQKQRTAIAGILAMHPECVVFDEASAMLDPDGRKELGNIVCRLHDEGITIILITHYMNEAVMADKVFVMDRGRIKMSGTPAQVFGKSDEIKALGLEMPVITELAIRMKENGYNMPVNIFTIKEFADKFEQMYKSK